MAWDWVAPAGTAAVGITGIAATYFTGERSRSNAKELAEGKNQHDLSVIREQRRQQRQAEAYIELLTFSNQMSHYLNLTDLETGAEPKHAAVPGQDVQARIRALLAAYGSAEAKECFQAWMAALLKANEVRKIYQTKVRISNVPEAAARKLEFGKLSVVQNELLDALGRQVAGELEERSR
jgi:hypothetical protein